VDRPPVQPVLWTHCCWAFEDVVDRRKWAVVPEFNDKHGHPIVVAREMIESVPARTSQLERSGVSGTRIGIDGYVTVEDPFVT